MSDTVSITGDSNGYWGDWRLESALDSQRVDRLIAGQVGCSGGYSQREIRSTKGQPLVQA